MKALEAAEAARKEEAKRAEERERRKALLDKRREEKLKDLGAAQVRPISCLISYASLYDLQVVIRSVKPFAHAAGVKPPFRRKPISDFLSGFGTCGAVCWSLGCWWYLFPSQPNPPEGPSKISVLLRHQYLNRKFAYLTNRVNADQEIEPKIFSRDQDVAMKPLTKTAFFLCCTNCSGGQLGRRL